MNKVSILILLFLFTIGLNCNRRADKSPDFEKNLLTQPDFLYMDTLSCYFKYIKEYIKNDPDQRNSYLLAVYHSEGEQVKVKIAAFKPVDVIDFNYRIPSSYFSLYGKNVYILTGMDYISIPDKNYIEKIREKFNKERHIDDLPPAWEIILDFDTCYYRKSNLSLILKLTERRIKKTKLIKPEN
jgi:hypothetical protein